MAKPIPPQMIVLAVIARSGNGLTLRDVVASIENLHRRGINTGYSVGVGGHGSLLLKELIPDVNTLKVLGLVKEVNGRLIVSEKGLEVLKKVSGNSDVFKAILDQGL